MSCPFHASWTSLLTSAVSGVGGVLVVLWALKTFYYICKNLFVFVLAEPLGLTVNIRKKGAWAVVTGATDGIGRGYAFDLARRGCNIVLISRTQSKLDNVAKDIERLYPKIKTKTIAFDFTEESGPNASGYDTIRRELQSLDIGTLVNNVGMITSPPDFYDKLAGGEDMLAKLIRCNCTSHALMTRIVLPGMVSRKRGIVISLSSFAGEHPFPLLAPYAASKAFNKFLGMALELEYRGTGIICQTIQPVLVATNMVMDKQSLFVTGPMEYARSCLNTVGWMSRTNGHPIHALQNWVVSYLPMHQLGRILRRIMVDRRDAEIASRKELS